MRSSKALWIKRWTTTRIFKVFDFFLIPVFYVESNFFVNEVEL